MFNGHRRYTPIGLDIKGRRVCAIQFERSGRQLSLHAHASVGIPEGEGSTGALEALEILCEMTAFAGRDVVSAVPEGNVDFRKIALPSDVKPVKDDAFSEALALEARSALPYDPEDAVLDYLPLGEEALDGQDLFSVLLIAARKEYVNHHLALLKAAGLRCIHLDVAPCAAPRALYADDSMYVLVEFDADYTSVSICRGPDLLFSRTIREGVGKMVERVAETLNVSPSEASYALRVYGMDARATITHSFSGATEKGLLEEGTLAAEVFEACGGVSRRFAAEIQRSMDYFSRQLRGGEVEAITLVGPMIPSNMDGYLAEALSMPVTAPGGFAVPIRGIETLGAQCSAFAVAAGLALWGEL